MENISFIFFDLIYSGKACLEERVDINSKGNDNIGKYCGRRYPWSVFASWRPIILEFHTYKLSSSKFQLHYQIASTILKTFLYKYENYNGFNTFEHINFTDPFSWNHIYYLVNVPYYVWSILVPKMCKLVVQILRIPPLKDPLILFDGPDFSSNYKKHLYQKEIHSKFFPGCNFVPICHA